MATTTTRPSTRPAFATRPGQRLERLGDEIVVCGQLFHTSAPVVLWTDPGGYDAYRVERRFAPWDKASWEETAKAKAGVKTPNRYGLREEVLSPLELEQVRGGGWPLELLREKVDQFVLHYDVCGISRNCFEVLHDDRGLSVHFLLDLDGTIYQTLDVKERAWHASVANSRSVGIEIANMGAYAAGEVDPFKQWYARDDDGRMRVTVPARYGDGGFRTPDFVPRPVRDQLVWGVVQGKRRRMYDLTAEQYDSLVRLTATLCTVLPKIRCDYPRDGRGRLIPHKLGEEQFAAFSGVLGHYHVQADKADPGPALQWDRVIEGARAMMKGTGSSGHAPARSPATAPAAPPATAPATRPSEEPGPSFER